MSIAAYCHRPACTVSPEETLRVAAERMKKEQVGLLVATEEGRAVGVLTDRDVTLHAAAQGRDAGTSRVADAMSRPVVSLPADGSVEDALARMSADRLRRLPVVDADGRPTGVVSADDLVRLLATEIGGLGEVLVAQLPSGSRPLARRAPGEPPRRLAEHYRGEVVAAAADAPVAEIAREMETHGVGSVVVLGAQGRAAGLVTDRDIAVRVVAEGLDPATTWASAIASTPLVAAAPSDPLEEVVASMRTASVRRIPILRDGRPVGIVSFDDLLVAFGRELGRLGACVAGDRVASLFVYPIRVRQELEQRLGETASQLRRLGDLTLRTLGREVEGLVDRVVGATGGFGPSRGSGVRVRDLMQRDVRTCTPGDTLIEAARIMWEGDCGCVPVVTDASSARVVGMITDRDLCMAAYTSGGRLAELDVAGAMSRQVHACRPEEDVGRAAALMRSARVRRLPVVDEEGRLRGLLSLADLAEAAAVRRAEVGAVLEAICRPRRAARAAP